MQYHHSITTLAIAKSFQAAVKTVSVIQLNGESHSIEKQYNPNGHDAIFHFLTFQPMLSVVAYKTFGQFIFSSFCRETFK